MSYQQNTLSFPFLVSSLPIMLVISQVSFYESLAPSVPAIYPANLYILLFDNFYLLTWSGLWSMLIFKSYLLHCPLPMIFLRLSFLVILLISASYIFILKLILYNDWQYLTILASPLIAEQKQDNQLEHTYSSYVKIRDVVQKTCQRWWTIGKSGERGSGISVRAARHDDDDVNFY